MVHCDGVIQVHVIKGDLYLNLFVRIEAVWWEYHCLATWVWPIGNSKKLDTTMNDWKAYSDLKSWSSMPSVTIFFCYISTFWGAPSVQLETWTCLCLLLEVNE